MRRDFRPMEAIEALRTALDAARAGRVEANSLQSAMAAVKAAVPTAFDPRNEKKYELYEREAFDAYTEAEQFLRASKRPTSAADAEGARPAKRRRVSGQ